MNIRAYLNCSIEYVEEMNLVQAFNLLSYMKDESELQKS